MARRRALLIAVAGCTSTRPATPPPAAQLFQPETFYPAGTSAVAVAIGDLDGDGRPDLAVANDCNATSGVVVLSNAGDGSFGAPTLHAAGKCTLSVAVGDFDGDGSLDLVAGDSDGVDVLLGSGHGGFAPPITDSGGVWGMSVVVRDVNGDGRPDIAVAGLVSTLRLNTGAAAMSSAAVIDGTDGNPTDLVVADLDGDGHDDIALVDHGPGSAAGVEIFRGNGDGSFAAPVTISVGEQLQAITAADFDGDGHVDLAVTDAATVDVLFGNGDGTFAPPLALSAHAIDIAAADVDGDGLPDLVLAQGVDIGVLLDQGARRFAPLDSYACDGCSRLAVGDLDGDGQPDVVGVAQGWIDDGLTGGSGVHVLLHR